MIKCYVRWDKVPSQNHPLYYVVSRVIAKISTAGVCWLLQRFLSSDDFTLLVPGQVVSEYRYLPICVVPHILDWEDLPKVFSSPGFAIHAQLMFCSARAPYWNCLR